MEMSQRSSLPQTKRKINDNLVQRFSERQHFSFSDFKQMYFADSTMLPYQLIKDTKHFSCIIFFSLFVYETLCT